jgi:tRNA threonylcarbamoyladenosine biosynthesis protein TsaE
MNVALHDLSSCAADMLERLLERPRSGAAVLGLSGELGAGKTTLTQELARALGVKETVASPTFVIAKRYETAHPRFKTLVHVDAYRLDSPEELDAVGWDEMLAERDALVVVEWPEKLGARMSAGALRATLTVVGDDMRECVYEESW